MKTVTVTKYVSYDGREFATEQACINYELSIEKQKLYERYNVPELTDDIKFGDSETCFSEIADCLQCVIDNLSTDKVDEIKEILMKLKSEVEW